MAKGAISSAEDSANDTSDQGREAPRALRERLRADTEAGPRERCEICGKFRAISEAHHFIHIAWLATLIEGTGLDLDDYLRKHKRPRKPKLPLKTVWLCPNHHAIVHRLDRAEKDVDSDGLFGELLDGIPEVERQRLLDLADNWHDPAYSPFFNAIADAAARKYGTQSADSSPPPDPPPLSDPSAIVVYDEVLLRAARRRLADPGEHWSTYLLAACDATNTDTYLDKDSSLRAEQALDQIAILLRLRPEDRVAVVSPAAAQEHYQLPGMTGERGDFAGGVFLRQPDGTYSAPRNPLPIDLVNRQKLRHRLTPRAIARQARGGRR